MRRHTNTVVGIAIVALTLTGCGSDEAPDPDTKPSAKPSVTDSAPALDIGIPPEPEGAARVAYLAALKAIDPALVVDPDKAIDAGRNQCSSLTGGGNDPAGTAAARFSTSGNEVTETEAKAINEALRQTLCPQQ